MSKSLFFIRSALAVAAAMIIVLILSSSAFSGPNDAEWDPPARYSGTYEGRLTVKRLHPSAVEAACAQLLEEKYTPGRKRRGCARWWPNPHRCTIIMIDRPAYGTTPNAVFRHERGHCREWPSWHPQ